MEQVDVFGIDLAKRSFQVRGACADGSVAFRKTLSACARQDEQAARLMTIPGIGPIGAMALQAFAPRMESFRRGRDFSAWLARMLARKPRKLVAVALANRMARIVWALMTQKESYRAPAAA